MKKPENTIEVSTDFTRKGLRDYVLSQLDEESYSDEAIYSVCEEFNERLKVKAQSLSEGLHGFGIRFEWMVDSDKAIYDAKEEPEEYTFLGSDETEWHGLDAILAFLRSEVDVTTVANDYWFGRSVGKWNRDTLIPS